MSRFIHLLLLASERAWAHAMHMKSTHSAESTSQGITGSTRRHIISRLHKGGVIASQLVESLKDKGKTGAKPETILEARAYHVSLVGAVGFEKQKWEECLKAYSESRLIYTVLAQSLLPQQHDPYRDLLSGTIDPSIRYAAYQLKLPRTLSINSIVARYVPRTGNEYVTEVLKMNPEALHEETTGATKSLAGNAEDVPKSIKWRSRTVHIEDAAIAQALAAVSTAEQRLSSLIASNPDLSTNEKASAYDEILIPSQDAVDATKTATEELSGEGVAPGDHRMQALQITRTAVNYDLVAWRIGRNRVLCGGRDGAVFEAETQRKPKRHRRDGKEWVTREESNGKKLARLRKRVVLYDATLQSLDSVKELPGVAADEAFMKELEAKRAYFAALRWALLHLSRRQAKILICLGACPSRGRMQSFRIPKTRLHFSLAHLNSHHRFSPACRPHMSLHKSRQALMSLVHKLEHSVNCSEASLLSIVPWLSYTISRPTLPRLRRTSLRVQHR